MDIATNEINILLRLETSIANNNIRVQKQTTAYGQYLEDMPTQNSRDDGRNAEIHLKAAQYLKARYCSRYLYLLFESGFVYKNICSKYAYALMHKY